MPIGGTNSEWNEMSVRAMRQAAARIMILTPEYMRSEWCMKEWGQFHEENKRRRGKLFGGGKPLQGVALTFPHEGLAAPTNGMPANGFANIVQIPVTKVTGAAGLAWRKANFAISEDALTRVIRACGPGL